MNNSKKCHIAVDDEFCVTIGKPVHDHIVAYLDENKEYLIKYVQKQNPDISQEEAMAVGFLVAGEVIESCLKMLADTIKESTGMSSGFRQPQNMIVVPRILN